MSQQGLEYEVYQMIRNVENRLCADCECALGDRENICACTRHGVWLCRSCASVHAKSLKDEEYVKMPNDTWTKQTVSVMKLARSNKEVNKVYSRYLPKSIKRLSKLSSDLDREIWINAKYSSMAFMLPNYHYNLDVLFSSSSTPAVTSSSNTVLPSRLVDFFIVIGPSMKTKSSLGETRIEDIRFTPRITSTYPDASFHSDCQIPDLLATLVYPSGMSLNNLEISPKIFSFVLTNVSGIRLFCTALSFNELAEPSLLSQLGIDASMNKHSNWKAIYSPKAIVLISHYPFYHFQSVVLSSLYWISLSVAPLPIERYVANTVTEIPLPPQGQVEIMFSIANATIYLSRPPKNQLPMIDFSYRPLFATLHVDCILTIFRFMIVEYPICFYSSNISLLTPIQESFMSFLFPFSWQGVYIPVLENSVIEILDAPVPFLVGIQSSLLLQCPLEYRSTGVLFVDIDSEVLHFGGQTVDFSRSSESSLLDIPLFPEVPTISKHLLMKLRSRLIQVGEVIHYSHNERSGKAIGLAGLPFPNNEHLSPLPFEALSGQNFAQRKLNSTRNVATNGHTVILVNNGASNGNNAMNATKGLSSGSSHGTNNSSSSNNGSNNNNNQSSQTGKVTIATVNSTIVEETGSNRIFRDDLLDPRYNARSNDDEFDALEIRGAFLRFFVALLLNYQDYLIYQDDQGKKYTPAAKEREKNSNSSLRRVTSSFYGAKQSISDKFDASHQILDFDRDDFLATAAAEDGLFLKNLLFTQLFASFIDDRIHHPEKSQLQLFDEHISLKRNRSVKQLRKIETPFINDRSDDIAETYTCSPPSSWGIDPSLTFNYIRFPSMDSALIGPLKHPKVVAKYLEDHSIAPAISWRASSASKASKTSASTSSEISLLEFSSIVFSLQQENIRRLQLLSSFQFACRFHLFRRSVAKLRSRIIRLQRWVRHCLALKHLHKLILLRKSKAFVYQAIRIQNWARMTINYHKYQRYRRSVVILQASYRAQNPRHRYLTVRRNIIRCQSWIRSYLLRRRIWPALQQQHLKLLKLVLLLWKHEYCPLVHRRHCWDAFQQTTLGFHHQHDHRGSFYEKYPSFLAQALCQDEVHRVFQSLDLYSLSFLKNERVKSSRAFILEAVLCLEKSSFLNSLKSSSKSTNSQAQNAMLTQLSLNAQERINELKPLELQERESIYQILKQLEMKQKPSIKGHTFDELFTVFHIEKAKKRKHGLATILWSSEDIDHAMKSYSVAKAIDQLQWNNKLNQDLLRMDETGCFIARKRQQRIQQALVEAANVFFVMTSSKKQ